jgi:hypothetical protein
MHYRATSGKPTLFLSGRAAVRMEPVLGGSMIMKSPIRFIVGRLLAISFFTSFYNG